MPISRYRLSIQSAQAAKFMKGFGKKRPSASTHGQDRAGQFPDTRKPLAMFRQLLNFAEAAASIRR